MVTVPFNPNMVSVLSAYVEQVIQINNRKYLGSPTWFTTAKRYLGGPPPTWRGGITIEHWCQSGGVIFWLTGWAWLLSVLLKTSLLDMLLSTVRLGRLWTVLSEANLLHRHLLSKSSRECDIFSRGAHCLSFHHFSHKSCLFYHAQAESWRLWNCQSARINWK